MHEPFSVVVYSRDRHPPGHCSFKESGGQWPIHCVDGTPGFEIHPSITVVDDALIVDKGCKKDVDAYSAFDGTGLTEMLRERRIPRVAVAGLTTEYCVRATAFDALKAGFEVWLLTDAIAGVDVNPGDAARALLEMRDAGIHLTDSGQIVPMLALQSERTALIIVDAQNDFCPGGALAAAEAPRIFEPLQKLLASRS